MLKISKNGDAKNNIKLIEPLKKLVITDPIIIIVMVNTIAVEKLNISLLHLLIFEHSIVYTGIVPTKYKKIAPTTIR